MADGGFFFLIDYKVPIFFIIFKNAQITWEGSKTLKSLAGPGINHSGFPTLPVSVHSITK